MNQFEENRYNNRRNVFDTVRNYIMAVLFIAMGVMMIFADKLNIWQLLEFDKMFRYFFGAICFLYGGFRIFRAVNNR